MPVQTFKMELWRLTSVPVDRQRLMCHSAWCGSLPSYVGEWDALVDIQLTEGMTIFLIGAADKSQIPPNKQAQVQAQVPAEVERRAEAAAAPKAAVPSNLAQTDSGSTETETKTGISQAQVLSQPQPWICTSCTFINVASAMR